MIQKNYDFGTYNLKLFAEHFSFKILDPQSSENAELQNGDMLSARSDVIYIGTWRYDDVFILLELLEVKPQNADNFDNWSHVEEANLVIVSDGITVMELLTEKEYTFSVPSDDYRVRVFYNNLSLETLDTSEQEETYKVMIWPDKYVIPTVLKKNPKSENEVSNQSYKT